MTFKSSHQSNQKWLHFRPNLSKEIKIQFLLYYLNMTPRQSTRTPARRYMAEILPILVCLGGHEIYNLDRTFLGHHNYILSLFLSDSIPRSRSWKKIFEEILNFTPFTPKLSPLRMGVMKFTISCLLTLQMLHTKYG